MEEERKEHIGGVPLGKISALMIVIIALISAALLYTTFRVYEGYDTLVKSVDHYIESRESTIDMIEGSNELTESVRRFVVMGDTRYLQEYFNYATVSQRRANALMTLHERDADTEAERALQRAMDESRALMVREIYAMRLVLSAMEIDLKGLPSQLKLVTLKSEDLALDAETKMEKARRMLFDDEYEKSKTIINHNAQVCAEYLRAQSHEKSVEVATELSYWLQWQRALIILLILTVAIIAVAVHHLAFTPLRRAVSFVRSKKPLRNEGAHEFRVLSHAYNVMLEETYQREEELTYAALHDQLTGLYNRAGLEHFCEQIDFASVAVLVIDIDHFKQINDTYGHAAGDDALCRVADLLRANFRRNDLIFRPAGDEFIVIMRKAGKVHTELIRQKIYRINHALKTPEDDIAPCSISVGVAFGKRNVSREELMHRADEAMYAVKNGGKSGCQFAE